MYGLLCIGYRCLCRVLLIIVYWFSLFVLFMDSCLLLLLIVYCLLFIVSGLLFVVFVCSLLGIDDD